MTFPNYEHAQEIFDRGDMTARCIASYIHRWMISRPKPADESLRPMDAFDMVYYYDCLARTFSGALGRPVECGLSADRAVTPINIPLLEQGKWRKCPFVAEGLAGRFLEFVREDAAEDGKPFDAGFACRIACAALDEAALKVILARRCEPGAASGFDEWLSGFSTPADDQISEDDDAERQDGRVPHALASRHDNGGTTR